MKGSLIKEFKYDIIKDRKKFYGTEVKYFVIK